MAGRKLIGVYLDPDIIKQLKYVAHIEKETNVSEIVRRAVEEFLAKVETPSFEKSHAGSETEIKPNISLLSEREKEILKLMARGLTNEQIGKELFISQATAKIHIHQILKKLNAKNRVQAVAYVTRHGLEF